MMSLLVRALLAVSGGVAAILVGSDAPDYSVVQGMIGLVATVLTLIAVQIVSPSAVNLLRRWTSHRLREAKPQKARAWAP